MSEEQITKNCKFCGKSLPEEAIFCYYCHRELLTRPERPSQNSESKPLNRILLIIGIVILVVIVFILFLR
jgi:predicted nucleic acid-binding Zn ribbon protein